MNLNENKGSWSEIVDAWRASGQSKAEFCKKQKIVVSRFYYWCGKLEKGKKKNSPIAKLSVKPVKNPAVREKPTVDEKPAFVEITLPKLSNPANVPGQVFRITTSYGAVMEIPL